MKYPWKILRKICGYLAAIMIGIIVVLFEKKELKSFTSYLINKIISVNHVLFLLVILGIFLLVYFFWLIHRRAIFKELWEVCKPAEKLKPEDFNIEKYSPAYIYRESDNKIKATLDVKDNLLVIGRPQIGKTRECFENIKLLKSTLLVKVKAQSFDIDRIKVPPFVNKNIVLFLDDLEKFEEHFINTIVNEFKRKSKHVTLVATCRTGLELNQIKNSFKDLYFRFQVVSIEEITSNDANHLAMQIGIQFNDKFDGTPGCITLGLSKMKSKYDRLGPEHKIILKSIKLMRYGGLFSYSGIRVKNVCKQVFQLSEDLMQRYVWDLSIERLKEDGFISLREEDLHVYDSYLDQCVYDYEPKSDFPKLFDFYSTVNDPLILGSLVQGYARHANYSESQKYIRKALSIYSNNRYLNFSLSSILTKEGQVKESIGCFKEAEDHYREAENLLRKANAINNKSAVQHQSLSYVLSLIGEICESTNRGSEAKQMFIQAETELKTALSKKPGVVAAYRSLGYVQGRLKERVKSEASYRKAISIDPKSAFTYNLLAHDIALQPGREREAEVLYEEAIKLKRDYPSALNNYAHLLAKLGKNDKAMKCYLRAIEVDSTYTLAFLNLGHLLRSSGEYEQAAKYYQQAIARNQKYPEAHYSLGYVLMKLEKYEQSSIEFEKAISLRKDYLEAIIELGEVYLHISETIKDSDLQKVERYLEKAEKQFKKAIELAPTNKTIQLNIAMLYERMNRNNDAIREYEKFLELDPTNIKTLFTYAYFLNKIGNTNRAQEIYEKLKKSGVRFPLDSARLARVLINEGDLNQAESVLNEALSIDSRCAMAYKNRGILYVKKAEQENNGQKKEELYKQAEKDYITALQIKRPYPSAGRRLGKVLIELKREREAEEQFVNTSKTSPEYAKNYFEYGKYLIKKKRLKEAQTHLKKAKELFEKQNKKKEANEVSRLMQTNI